MSSALNVFSPHHRTGIGSIRLVTGFGVAGFVGIALVAWAVWASSDSKTSSETSPQDQTGGDVTANTTQDGDDDSTKIEQTENTVDTSVDTGTDESADEPTEDDRIELLVGTWTQQYFGERVITIREDGTATMVVRPSGIWAFTIGKEVTIQIEWSLDGEMVTLTSVSGEPQRSFEAATKIFGRERIRRLDDLNDEHFVLVNLEDHSESEWKRVSK